MNCDWSSIRTNEWRTFGAFTLKKSERDHSNERMANVRMNRQTRERETEGFMTTTMPSPHPRSDAFKRSFTQSNYITAFCNWLMTLMSTASDLAIFTSILYT